MGWMRRATVLFLVLSLWVPFMAFCTRQPSDLTVVNVAVFEALLAILTFGSLGALHALHALHALAARRRD